MKTYRPLLAIALIAIAILVMSCSSGGGGGGGAGPMTPPGPTLVLFAGDVGGFGNVDGLGTAARFQTPQGIAADASGNVYVAEGGQSTIRRITPSGVVTDSAGNVYVADMGNHTIRMITPAGVVSTFAGTPGAFGSVDGAGASARFNGPDGMTVDTLGNLYVADSGNHTVRMITPAGLVSIVAGSAGVPGSADGTGTAAMFSYPSGVAADTFGNVYVADISNQAIRKIAAGGVVSTLAGSVGNCGSADGTGSAAQFFNPTDVATDAAGNIYVTDSSTHIIRKITPAGEVTTFAGIAGLQGPDDGAGANARFDSPFAIAAGPGTALYVGEGGNNAVRRITAAAEVTTIAGAAALFGYVDAAGSLARFDTPRSIIADTTGNSYVADGGNNGRLRRVTAAGDVTTQVASLRVPGGLTRDAAGNIYIADTYNHVIRKIDTGGTPTIIAGTLGTPGSADGNGIAASFNFPQSVAVDAAGNVYVADSDNHTIRMITPAGDVTTIAGTAGSFGSTDDTGSAARFRFPHDLVSDATGTLYVTDRLNYTVRKIGAGGVVTTLAGAARQSGAADGAGAAARFESPYGVGMDSAGNLYIADANNNTIRKVTPAGVVTTVVGAFGRFGVQLGALPASLSSPRDVAVRPDGELVIVTANGVVVTQGF